MKKIIYYFSFSYLKPKYYWPIRIILIIYYLVIFFGLIYDLNTEKIRYYSDINGYLNLLLSDSVFYYIYIVPVFVIYFISVILEFIITIDKNNNIRRK